MEFMVWGERNSGTNFLEHVLWKNFNLIKNSQRETIFHGKKTLLKNWKHGIPNNDYKKELSMRVVDIFIFRELNPWLISMNKNPYDLLRIKNFNDFLTSPQKSFWGNNQHGTTNLNSETNKVINDSDNGSTIFDIRYNKFNKICEYRDKNKDVIFVKLEYLQNEENLLNFLKSLSDKYGIEKKNNYSLNFEHTKINPAFCGDKNIKNRKYDINIDDFIDTIDLYKNIEIEKIIDNMTFTIN